jgi:hypothetical protein
MSFAARVHVVYIATRFQQPSPLAVRADGTGDVTKTHIAWTLRRAAPLTPSPLLSNCERLPGRRGYSERGFQRKSTPIDHITTGPIARGARHPTV